MSYTVNDLVNVEPDPRTALIAGLRDLAAWLESNPDAPVTWHPKDILHHVRVDDDAAGTAEVERIARVMGVQVDYDGHIVAERRFGPVGYRAVYITKAWDAERRAQTSYEDSVQPEAVTSDG